MCAFLFRTHRRVTITMSHGGVTLEPSTALTKVTMAKGRAPLVWDLPRAPSPLPPGDLKGYSQAPNVAASKRRDIHNKDYDHDDIESHMPIDAIVCRHEEPPTSTRPTAREMYEEFKHLAVFNVSDMVKLKKAGMTGIAFDLYH